MLIGVPGEIKNHEYRVGLTPAGVGKLHRSGHDVLIQSGAGLGIGFSDEDYQQAGASLAENAQAVFAKADLVVKVKEPQPGECAMLREGQTLFAYLHLAPDPEQTRLLLESKSTCIAYETITDDSGGLPLLTPMSEVAGRMAAQQAALCLEKAHQGSGVLMGGVPGVPGASVLVIGGGVVGLNAARVAFGMGANVTIADKSIRRLQHIDDLYHGQIKTIYSSTETIAECLPVTDAVIGAVLIPGATAPRLISRDMLKLMRKGSVLVDVSIDQGGCFETSKPTTHENPIYLVDGIVHYCVANMPGGVARTSAIALTNATLPFIVALANQGPRSALLGDSHFLEGLNVHRGMVTNAAVAEALNHDFVPPQQALAKMPCGKSAQA
ncbi:MAG: alanine dehydrogenase [Gammaproteobacteria bacterium]|nr:alanine dehydrogenase [Gammaproteobacteria bacterium]MCY4358193.1 alanine dehydrogenase [Gammaproteobacteria bacterium]